MPTFYLDYGNVLLQVECRNALCFALEHSLPRLQLTPIRRTRCELFCNPRVSAQGVDMREASSNLAKFAVQIQAFTCATVLLFHLGTVANAAPACHVLENAR